MSVAGSGPAELGFSNERTALAWQRTALSLLAGAAVLGRLTFAQLGWAAIALLGVAALLCLWVFAESRWRYVQQLGVRHRTHERDGRAAMSLTVATCLIALTESAALLR
jgi:uncharacterized membrane protein YidH (DUF202 family)